MDNCKFFKDHLYRFIDSELDDASCKKMEEHQGKCPLCQMELENETQVDQLFRSHLEQEEAPFELRESVIQSLEQARPWWQKIFAFVTLKPALSFGVSCLALVMVFSLINRSHSPQQPFPIFAKAVDTHLELLKGVYPVEIQTQDINEALAWFEGKVDFAIQEPHVPFADAQLVGARLVHIKDKKAAYFIYEKDGRKISALSMNMKDMQLSEDALIVKDDEHSKILVQTDRGYKSVVCLHKSNGTGCIVVYESMDDPTLVAYIK